MYENEYPSQNNGVQMGYDPHSPYGRFRAEENWYARLKAQSGLLALTVIVNILILYLLQTVGDWALYSLLRATGFSLISIDAVYELYTMVIYFLAFLLPYLAYAKAVRYPLGSIVRDTPYTPVLASCVGISLGISVAGVLLSMITAVFFAMFGLYPMELPIILPDDPLTMALMVINTTAVPALIEEFVNRGVILGSLRQYGDRFAITASALIFALLHRNMTQFPNAFLLGLALGYFVVKTNSIWTGVAIHFTNNLLALLLSVASENMSIDQGWFLQGTVFLFYLVAAGCGLLYLFAIRHLHVSLRISDCPLRGQRLWRSFLLNFPAVMMLLLFAWVIFLNFSR